MPFDTLTATAIKVELEHTVVSGRVQRVVQPSVHSVAMEIYAGSRRNLVISADPQSPYIALADQKSRRGTENPSPIEQLLRKYVRGARLVAIEQPHLERILVLRFSGPEGTVLLVCEMMGRLANIILVNDENVVLDSIHRVPPSVNRFRTILPRKPYAPPPSQNKLDPLSLDASELALALAKSDRDLLWQKLVATLLGLSPLAAREAAYRACGSLDSRGLTTEEHRVLSTLSEMWQETEAGNHACTAGKNQYAPYRLTHLAPIEGVATVSAAILFTEAARGKADPYGQARARIRAIIQDQTERLEGKIKSLERSLVPEQEIELIKQHGNAILGMAWQIKPHQDALVVDASLFGGEQETEWRIRLDPRLSAPENAQQLFARYRKRKDAAVQIPGLIQETKEQIAYLEQLLTDLELAQDRNQIDQVEQALVEGGYQKPSKRRPRPKHSEPRRVTAPDGTTIILGRNSRENELVTFRIAGPGDVWLHAHGVPGSHVVIRNADLLADDTLLFAAELAAFYSNAPKNSRVQVDFCERRHVKHMKGRNPGMVLYTHEQTITVEPVDHLTQN